MSGLIASSPLFLWMLPLAGLPVIFHLFLKMQRRTRVFPTLMFFHRMDPKLSARRQIREWLILLLRTLLIFFTLLALARPVWVGISGGGKISTVLLIDNSGSMTAPGNGGQTKLQQALAAARAIVDDVGPKALVGIVLLVDDPTVSLPDAMVADKALLKSSLDQVAETEATGNPGPALRKALQLLQGSPDDRFEIHVLTDLQESEWAQLVPALPSARPGTMAVVHQFSSPPPKEGNVAILETELPRRRLLAGRKFPARIVLANTTAFDATVRLSTADDLGQKSSQSLAVPKNKEVAANVPLQPGSPGLHWVNVWIEGDGFDTDNRAGLAFSCSTHAPVWFLGKPVEFALLPVALAPTGKGSLSGLKPFFFPGTDFKIPPKEDRPVLVVLRWAALLQFHQSDSGAEARLKDYVEKGGNLLIVPGPSFDRLTGQLPEWTGAFPIRAEQEPKGKLLLAFEKNAPLWQELRDEKGEVLLRNMKSFKYIPLTLANDADSLLGLEDGTALLAARRVKAGAVYSSGIVFNTKSSTLPLKGGFLAMVQTMALSSNPDNERTVSLAAGKGLPARQDAHRSVHIRSVSGSALDWKGRLGDFPVFPRSGVYAIQAEDDLQYVYVRASDRESRYRYLVRSPVPALAGLRHELEPYSGIPSFLAEFRKRRLGLDLFLPLVLLALLALLMESWLLNQGPRKGRHRAPAFGRNRPQPVLASFVLLGVLQWHPRMNAFICGLLVLAVAVWMRFLYIRIQRRFSKSKALLLLWPKVLVASLLLLALFEPVWSWERPVNSQNKILLLRDTSSSMGVKDRNGLSRAERARKIEESIRKKLPSDIRVKTLEFDSTVRDQSDPAAKPASGKVRETDLGGCLLTLSERPEIASYMTAVVLTDGGDEVVQSARLPSIPVSFIGIGSNSRDWDDLMIAGVNHPLTVEKEVNFEISADLVARTGGGTSFARRLARVSLYLETRKGDTWEQLKAKSVDLSRRRARVKFTLSCDSPGIRQYRLRADVLPGEMSGRNNSRTISIDVRKKSLHVLFFTRELGMDFKMLRNELAHDPGVTFTALFRTYSERFTVQGERPETEEDLSTGFPTSKKTLDLYDCVVLGSFAAEYWSREQMEALLEYVDSGGAIIFLGGPHSFGQGGYSMTPLAPLFPWQISNAEHEPQTGRFSLTVPGPAASQSIMAGLKELLSSEGEAIIESVNFPGQLRPAATALLEAVADNQIVPVVARQSFGKGKCLGVATNTLWRWPRKSVTLRDAYSRFWRQAVRDLASDSDKGRVLSVAWDREMYRPGEQATATVRIGGRDSSKGLRLSATLTRKGTSHSLNVESDPGEAGAFQVRAVFRDRGDYVFRIVAYQGDQVLESYERTLRIAPLLEEGANLEVDHEFLKRLAEKASGTYVREDDASTLIRQIAARAFRKTAIMETPLTQAGPYFPLLLVLLLVAEWITRRKMNLF